MEEIWKDIEDYEGLYQVSNLGRVKSIKFGYDRFLSHRVGKRNNKGRISPHHFVDLYKDNKRKTKPIHQLVANAFIGKCPPDCNQIDHIDGNPENNLPENLRWCDGKGNMSNPITRQRLRDSIHRYWELRRKS